LYAFKRLNHKEVKLIKNKKTLSQTQLKELERTYYQNNPNITLKKAQDLYKIDSNNIFINQVIAASLRTLKRFEESLKYFKKSLKLNPTADAYSNVGVVLNGLKRYEEAVESYTKALELDANNAAACSNLGNVLFELSRYDEAIEYCKKAITLKPDFVEAYNNLGRALSKIDENDEALTIYNKAIEINPKLASLYNGKAAVLIEKENYTDAIKNCNIAIQLNKNLADPYFTLGTALMYIGKYEESFINLKQALDIEKTNISMYDVLFQLYLQTNNHSKIDIHKYIKHFKTTKFTNENMQVINYLAIDKFIDADIKSTKEYLDKLMPFITKSSLSSQDPDTQQFIIAYYNYLQSMLKVIDPNIKIDNTLEKIYHIGESHSLSFANQTLSIEEKKYLVKPCIIFGAKAFHMSESNDNKFKLFLQNHIKNIPDNSKVIISFGEIDCRSDEGIIPYALKSGKTIDEIVDTTVKGYINYVQTLLQNRNITAYFTAVPAPVIKEESQNELLRIEVVQKFNKTLKQELDKASLNFLDTHSFTTNEKGSSNLKYMCDDFHLSPKAINQLQVLFNALDANKKKQTSNTIDFSKYQTVSLSKPS